MRPPNPSLALAAIALFLAPAKGGAAELDDYIAEADGALAHPVHNEFELLGARVVNVRLTSQRWRGHRWQHWLTVIVPPAIDPHGKGVLVIDGGSAKSGAPAEGSQKLFMVATSALQLRAPVALLGQVPNQPMFDGLYEDDLIAHTFDRYLDTGEADWPALLPMTKSATRAMDALSAMAGGGELGAFGWENFIVTGASKRGWTTYLTAAVDKRVIAMAPMVIDVLNMPAQMENQLKSYGGFSDMIRPYTSRGVQERADTPEGKKLNGIVDPFAYRGRYTMPKLVMLGTNDPYWTVDSSGLYFGDLPSPKSLCYLPNAGHGLGLNALKTGNAFFAAQLDGKAFPELGYRLEGDALNVSWEGAAKAAEHWSASSPTRDFREAKWAPEVLEITRSLSTGGVPREGGTVVARTGEPADGYVASFVRITFRGVRDGMGDFHLATPITVSPTSFQHPAPAP